ncbi:hypothetical protein IWX46DRAFT_594475 [Phyllosticta citricarpa]|uniref:Uncharacterized protein n=1 Tax=Phyllosticta citricarpa TaxID=55181 RepID=A0ABR1MLH6_9PEZI
MTSSSLALPCLACLRLPVLSLLDSFVVSASFIMWFTTTLFCLLALLLRLFSFSFSFFFFFFLLLFFNIPSDARTRRLPC